jgi:hypothetical protein
VAPSDSKTIACLSWCRQERPAASLEECMRLCGTGEDPRREKPPEARGIDVEWCIEYG